MKQSEKKNHSSVELLTQLHTKAIICVEGSHVGMTLFWGQDKKKRLGTTTLENKLILQCCAICNHTSPKSWLTQEICSVASQKFKRKSRTFITDLTVDVLLKHNGRMIKKKYIYISIPLPYSCISLLARSGPSTYVIWWLSSSSSRCVRIGSHLCRGNYSFTPLQQSLGTRP